MHEIKIPRHRLHNGQTMMSGASLARAREGYSDWSGNISAHILMNLGLTPHINMVEYAGIRGSYHFRNFCRKNIHLYWIYHSYYVGTNLQYTIDYKELTFLVSNRRSNKDELIKSANAVLNKYGLNLVLVDEGDGNV